MNSTIHTNLQNAGNYLLSVEKKVELVAAEPSSEPSPVGFFCHPRQYCQLIKIHNPHPCSTIFSEDQLRKKLWPDKLQSSSSCCVWDSWWAPPSCSCSSSVSLSPCAKYYRRPSITFLTTTIATQPCPLLLCPTTTITICKTMLSCSPLPCSDPCTACQQSSTLPTLSLQSSKHQTCGWTPMFVKR